MGSYARQRALEAVANFYGNQIIDYFKPLLVGKTIDGISGIDVGHYVSGEFTIGGDDFTVIERWADEEEEYEEVVKSFEDEFYTYLSGRVIDKITVTLDDMDDELFLLCSTSETNGGFLIPLGFNPEDWDFYGYIEHIIPEEQLVEYVTYKDLLRDIDNFVSYKATLPEHKYNNFVKNILVPTIFPESVTVKGEIPAYIKMNTIKGLLSQKASNFTELTNKVKAVALM